MVPICSLSPSQSIQNLQYQCMDTSPTDGLFNYEWWGHMMKWRSRFGIGFLIVYPLGVGNGRVSCRIPMCGAYGGLYPNLSRINFLGPSFFGINFYSKKRAQPQRYMVHKKYPDSILGPWGKTSLDNVPVAKVLFISLQVSNKFLSEKLQGQDRIVLWLKIWFYTKLAETPAVG